MQQTEPAQANDIVVPSTFNRSNEVTAVVHDANNMIAALNLYCDLIQEPGVLAAPYVHYSGELRLVAAASRRLVDKLVSLQPTEMTPLADVSQESGDSAVWPRSPSSPWRLAAGAIPLRSRRGPAWRVVSPPQGRLCCSVKP